MIFSALALTPVEILPDGFTPSIPIQYIVEKNADPPSLFTLRSPAGPFLLNTPPPPRHGDSHWSPPALQRAPRSLLPPTAEPPWEEPQSRGRAAKRSCSHRLGRERTAALSAGRRRPASTGRARQSELLGTAAMLQRDSPHRAARSCAPRPLPSHSHRSGNWLRCCPPTKASFRHPARRCQTAAVPQSASNPPDTRRNKT